MKNKLVIVLILIILILLGYIGYIFFGESKIDIDLVVNKPGQNLPATCMDADLSLGYGTPTITSINIYSGKVGDTIEVRGCNFLGFEGDKTFEIEDSKGSIGVIYAQRDSEAHKAVIKLNSPLCDIDNSYSGLPCNSYLDLVPGEYKISSRGGNKANFVITQ
jgi:hypothetical protein